MLNEMKKGWGKLTKGTSKGLTGIAKGFDKGRKVVTGYSSRVTKNMIGDNEDPTVLNKNVGKFKR